MGGGRFEHVQLGGPKVIKEIGLGVLVGLTVAGIWKKNQWDNQKIKRTFYDALERGEVSVVVEEE